MKVFDIDQEFHRLGVLELLHLSHDFVLNFRAQFLTLIRIEPLLNQIVEVLLSLLLYIFTYIAADIS